MGAGQLCCFLTWGVVEGREEGGEDKIVGPSDLRSNYPSLVFRTSAFRTTLHNARYILIYLIGRVSIFLHEKGTGGAIRQLAMHYRTVRTLRDTIKGREGLILPDLGTPYSMRIVPQVWIPI